MSDAAYQRKWRAEHRDQVNARVKELRDGRRDELHKEYQRAYQNRKSPEYTARLKLYNRQRNLRLKYGLTMEAFDAMWESQGGLCRICGEAMTPWQEFKASDRKAVNVEHDHASGAVRGLVCNGCNLGLAWFEKHQRAVMQHLGLDPEGR